VIFPYGDNHAAIHHCHPQKGTHWREMLKPLMSFEKVHVSVVQGENLEDWRKVKKEVPHAEIVAVMDNNPTLGESSTFPALLSSVSAGPHNWLYYSHSKGCSDRWAATHRHVGKTWGLQMHKTLLDNGPDPERDCTVAWVVYNGLQREWCSDGNFWWLSSKHLNQLRGLSYTHLYSVIQALNKAIHLKEVRVLRGANKQLRSPDFWNEELK
jgi:hypothetical protein